MDRTVCGVCGSWLGDDELLALRAEVAALRAASELSLGILWMIEHRSGKVRDAHTVLLDALGKDGLKRGITAAIGRGYEAEHPDGADWWAGKKE